MLRMVAGRLLTGVFVMWGAASLIFLIVRVAPGDPAAVLLGPEASRERVAELTADLGLDRPLAAQYASYLADVLRLDFGESHRLGSPAMEVVLERLPATAELTLVATGLAVAGGLTLGLLAGRRPGGRTDRAVSAVTLVLQSLPTFWVGILGILVFALALGALPSAGVGSPLHMVLPASTLALPFLAMVARLTRASVAEVRREPHLVAARARGLAERRLLLRHTLPHALVPVVTVVGLQAGALLGGAVVVENVFAWPGLGSLVVDAVANRDYAVVQAVALLLAAAVTVLNLAADVACARLDPRVRLEAAR